MNDTFVRPASSRWNTTARRTGAPTGHRFLAQAVAIGSLAILAACSSSPKGPEGLRIDDSIQAVSHSSRVSSVVLHYTATNTPQAIEILSKQNVSSHYLITDESPPKVYQLVDESRRAWHAGVSEWYGRSDLNSASIGIEIVNPGPVGSGWQPYTEEQISVLIMLLRDIVTRHQIHARNVVGHSDVAPQRKQDPGPAFPWKRLADAGLARWYDEQKAAALTADYQRNGLPPIRVIQQKLQKAGYPIALTGVLDKETLKVVRAFQMRYRPELHDGQPDVQTVAILDALP